jgi:hypothetical protein
MMRTPAEYNWAYRPPVRTEAGLDTGNGTR